MMDDLNNMADLNQAKYNELQENLGEILPDIINKYIDNTSDIINDLQDALKCADYDLLRQKAHQLKGSSLTIGADFIAVLCKELEQGAGESTPSPHRLSEMVEQLTPALQRLTEKLGL